MAQTVQDFIDYIVKTLQKELAHCMPPLVDQMIAEFGHDPYMILICCLLSLRAKDVVTIHVCRTLFSSIRTPEELLEIPLNELERIIYKTGYYRNKATVIREVSEIIIEHHDGQVPNSLEKLIAMKGVGIKTANLVIGLGFNIPAICVDTHVHRISNIFNLITTKTPEQTEEALRKILPKKYWIEWNRILVMLGQNICTAPRPKCSACPLNAVCPKKGVTTHR